MDMLANSVDCISYSVIKFRLAEPERFFNALLKKTRPLQCTFCKRGCSKQSACVLDQIRPLLFCVLAHELYLMKDMFQDMYLKIAYTIFVH